MSDQQNLYASLDSRSMELLNLRHHENKYINTNRLQCPLTAMPWALPGRKSSNQNAWRSQRLDGLRLFVVHRRPSNSVGTLLPQSFPKDLPASVPELVTKTGSEQNWVSTAPWAVHLVEHPLYTQSLYWMVPMEYPHWSPHFLCSSSVANCHSPTLAQHWTKFRIADIV